MHAWFFLALLAICCKWSSGLRYSGITLIIPPWKSWNEKLGGFWCYHVSVHACMCVWEQECGCGCGCAQIGFFQPWRAAWYNKPCFPSHSACALRLVPFAGCCKAAGGTSCALRDGLQILLLCVQIYAKSKWRERVVNKWSVRGIVSHQGSHSSAVLLYCIVQNSCAELH